MKANFSVANTFRILLLGAVFLFAMGALAPQPVEARMEFQRAMPVTDGDPDDGLDYSGGGSGAGFIPPEEIPVPPVSGRSVYSLNSFQFSFGNNPTNLFLLMPNFNGKSLFWTITIIAMPGGSN